MEGFGEPDLDKPVGGLDEEGSETCCLEDTTLGLEGPAEEEKRVLLDTGGRFSPDLFFIVEGEIVSVDRETEEPFACFEARVLNLDCETEGPISDGTGQIGLGGEDNIPGTLDYLGSVSEADELDTRQGEDGDELDTAGG